MMIDADDLGWTNSFDLTLYLRSNHDNLRLKFVLETAPFLRARSKLGGM